ncbi:unnamed protein product, partial [marine sediment metagenome]
NIVARDFMVLSCNEEGNLKTKKGEKVKGKAVGVSRAFSYFSDGKPCWRDIREKAPKKANAYVIGKDMMGENVRIINLQKYRMDLFLLQYFKIEK